MSTDHKAEAERLMMLAGEIDSTSAATAAVAEATLYAAEQTAELVEQQRIANILTLARMEAEGGSTDRATFDAVFENVEPGSFGVVYGVRSEIREGLGLA